MILHVQYAHLATLAALLTESVGAMHAATDTPLLGRVRLRATFAQWDTTARLLMVALVAAWLVPQAPILQTAHRRAHTVALDTRRPDRVKLYVTFAWRDSLEAAQTVCTDATLAPRALTLLLMVHRRAHIVALDTQRPDRVRLFVMFVLLDSAKWW